MDDALKKIDELEADHERANEAHEAVDAIGSQWLAEGVLRGEDVVRLQSLLRGLRMLYDHHIEVEDTEVFPAAAALLSGADQIAVGREMAARRGLSADIVRDALEETGIR